MCEIFPASVRNFSTKSVTRDKQPVSWNEATVAVNGAWIEASTMLPDGGLSVEMRLVQHGKIVEKCSTTVAKLGGGTYNHQTGVFQPRGRLDFRAGQPWGVDADMSALKDAFETKLELGDCVVLRVPPCPLNGEIMVHY